MEVEPDAIVIVVLGGVACEILEANSYSNAGFNLVPAEAYDGNFKAIGGGVFQHEARPVAFRSYLFRCDL